MKAQRLLREGQTVEVEGVTFKKREGEITVGDWYIAERNEGPRLLTARKIVFSGDFPSFIVPEEMAYCYDWHECVRVEIVE